MWVFYGNKIDATGFVSLVQKDEFVKSIMEHMQQSKDTKQEISDRILVVLQLTSDSTNYNSAEFPCADKWDKNVFELIWHHIEN